MLSSPIASRMDGVSRYAREKGCCARVSADHVSAGRLAVAHLAERNYRSRVFFTLDWDGNVRNRIWRGFTESGPAEKWVFSRECPNVRWDDWNAVGRWLAGKFAAADKPLGVLAYSQGEAVLLMDAALGLGIRVPDELVVIAGFTNACRNVDANIGRIVYAYKAAGLWEGAAVVFVADHGGHDKTHGDATLECFEVPFLVSGPAARGLHLREPVVLADTAPTILSLLGLGIPDTMRGRPAIPN